MICVWSELSRVKGPVPIASVVSQDAILFPVSSATGSKTDLGGTMNWVAREFRTASTFLRSVFTAMEMVEPSAVISSTSVQKAATPRVGSILPSSKV